MEDQKPGIGFDPEAELETNTTQLDRPVEEWTQKEVEVYYNAHVKDRPASELSEIELEVAARHGALARNRRETAERKGHDAEVEKIRRQVQATVDRYARLALLTERFRQGNTELRRDQEPQEVEVVIRHGQCEVAVKLSDFQTAYGTLNSSKPKEFEKLVLDLLAVTQSAAHQQRIRIERAGGRDWTAHTEDIRWKGALELHRLKYGA